MLKNLAILFLVFSYAVASDPVIIKCKPTVEIEHATNQIPKYFESSNNLLRKNSEFFTATGEKIFISGRLTDVDCVPISDAKVYIWHPNADDKYQYKQNDQFSLKKGYDPYFNGSGSITTDNLGRFSFITIFPEKSNNPYINFIVKHKDFKTFHTKMFFNPQKDKNLKSLVAKPLKSNEQYTSYEFNIRLSKKNLYVSY